VPCALGARLATVLSMSLEELIGQTLVFGIPGTRVTPADIKLFKDTRAAGLILFRINFESPAQVKKLISDLENGLGRRILVTCDHEGGRVVMFRDGVTVFPDNLAFGRAGRMDYARRQGTIEGRELGRLGVDVNFSPVVDILTETFSPNIGIRAYGRDAALVGKMAAARIAAMQAAGVSACAKHFPGQGHSPKDAHLSLPVLPSTWPEMRRKHIKPFLAAMKAGVDVVMSSHPIYPKLDPTPRRPATFSRRLITGYLREELAYGGVIASDDLEMGAIKELCPIGRAAVLTMKAGHDLILSCHDAARQREVFSALIDGFRAGELSVTELEKSVARVQALKDKRPHRFAPGAAKPEPGGAALAARVAREGLYVRDRKNILPLKRDVKTVAVVFPRLSDFAKRIMIERPLENEAAYLKNRLGRVKAAKNFVIVPVDPSEDDVRKAAAAARKADAVVHFCFDAHLYKGGKLLLDTLQKTAKSYVLALLRDPYDEAYARPATPVVTAHGFRVCQIDACLAKIFA